MSNRKSFILKPDTPKLFMPKSPPIRRSAALYHRPFQPSISPTRAANIPLHSSSTRPRRSAPMRMKQLDDDFGVPSLYDSDVSLSPSGMTKTGKGKNKAINGTSSLANEEEMLSNDRVSYLQGILLSFSSSKLRPRSPRSKPSPSITPLSEMSSI